MGVGRNGRVAILQLQPLLFANPRWNPSFKADLRGRWLRANGAGNFLQVSAPLKTALNSTRSLWTHTSVVQILSRLLHAPSRH
jgi:hypothetical protein